MADDISEFEAELTRRPPFDPNPSELLGWPTKRLAALDGLAPGLLARVLRSAPLTRQAIFAALAITSDEATDRRLASVLRSGKAREIIAHCRGDVPNGLLGALERMGGEPLPRSSYYHLLIDIFANPEKRAQARALRHVGRISKLTLDAVTVLEPKWLHVNVLTQSKNLREVCEFQASVKLLQSLPQGPSDAAVDAALLAMGPKSDLGSVIARLIKRTRCFPDQPVTGDEDFTPLMSAMDLLRGSLRFRNCLRQYTLAAITGRVAFASYRGDKAIAEFRRLGDRSGWLLMDIHAPQNGPVSDEVALEVRAACAARGITYLADGRTAREWAPLMRMAESGGVYDWTV